MSHRVLITGAAGFIGCHLARRLAEAGDDLTLIDNFARTHSQSGYDAEWETLIAYPNVRVLNLDLTDPASYARLDDGYDEVYHLAAIVGVENVVERPHHVIRVNSLATLLLLDWFVASDSRALLFSSTSEAYAWTKLFHDLPVPTPEDVPLALTDISNPRSSYAGSKIFGELAVTHYCTQHDKPFAIVRYHNVYGPRMGFSHVIPQIYYRVLDGESPLTVYSADHQRAFCYVDDALDATIAAIRTPAARGQTLNIGNDREEVTIAELTAHLLAVAEISVETRPAIHENDPIKRRCPDTSRARDLLGYAPHVSLDDGLRRTLAWYKAQYNHQTRED